MLGFVGRLISAMSFRDDSFVLGDGFQRQPSGHLGRDFFYVVVGCTVQFFIGLGLASFARSQSRADASFVWSSFFR